MLRSAAILLTLLILAGIAACGGSNVAIPEATTPSETASSTETATATFTEGRSGQNYVQSYGTRTEIDAPAEILPGVENGSLCSEFEMGSYDPADLDKYKYFMSARGDWADENYIRWSPDGSQILFDVATRLSGLPVDLYSVAANGSRLEKIVDASSREPLWGNGGSMMNYDMSPDGSRIAYSACAYNRKPVEDSRDDDWVYNYDIAFTNMDGTEVGRLTATPGFENFPVWSPDGSHIAYFSSHADFRGGMSHRFYRDPIPITGWITIYNLETGYFKYIAPSEGNGIMSHPPAWSPSPTLRNVPMEEEIIPLPPVWSPDGEKLAFVVYEGAVEVAKIDKFTPAGLWLKAALYVVGVDGTGLTRITEAASGPAWSPDGQRIAVAVPVNELNADLYTFAANGSDPVLVEKILPRARHNPINPWMGNLSWSPDGSQILFEQFAHIVNLDGSPANNSVPSELIQRYGSITPTLAAWSPDGSKIAIRTENSEEWRYPPVVVYVMNRDGSNPRVLAESYRPRPSHAELEFRLAE